MNQYTYQPRRPSNIPDVILVLLVTNGLVFAAQMLTVYPNFYFGWVDIHFALWPDVDGPVRGWPAGIPQADFRFWQLLTYGFLHGNLMHVAFNMFVLWMFGRDLEYVMGPKRFLTYYLVCVVGAGIVQFFVAQGSMEFIPTVGASGGVFGLLLAYGMTFPNRTVMLLFPPIPMKAKFFVILIGVFELFVGFSGGQPSVANFAHLGGMFFGYALLQYWKRTGRR